MCVIAGFQNFIFFCVTPLYFRMTGGHWPSVSLSCDEEPVPGRLQSSYNNRNPMKKSTPGWQPRQGPATAISKTISKTNARKQGNASVRKDRSVSKQPSLLEKLLAPAKSVSRRNQQSNGANSNARTIRQVEDKPTSRFSDRVSAPRPLQRVQSPVHSPKQRPRSRVGAFQPTAKRRKSALHYVNIAALNDDKLSLSDDISPRSIQSSPISPSRIILSPSATAALPASPLPHLSLTGLRSFCPPLDSSPTLTGLRSKQAPTKSRKEPWDVLRRRPVPRGVLKDRSRVPAELIKPPKEGRTTVPNASVDTTAVMILSDPWANTIFDYMNSSNRQ